MRYWIVVVGVIAGCGPGTTEEPLELVPWAEIVFVRSDDDCRVLMTVERDGSGLGPIYQGGATPFVSADGHHIAWVEDGTVRLLSQESSEAMVLEGVTRSPLIWSPVDPRLAAVRDDGTLVVLEAETDTERTLASTTNLRRLAWSPLGQAIAYGDGDGVRMVDVDSGTITTLMSTDGNVELAWSPDGSALAVGYEGVIHVVDMATSSAVPVIELATYSTAPPPRIQWSPGGDWLAWIIDDASVRGGIVRPDGTESESLYDFLEGTPTWSPSGARVVFSQDPSGHGCFDGDCNAISIHELDTEQTRFVSGVRSAGWAPDDDVLALILERFDELLQPMTRRVAIFDTTADELLELGDLDPEDPRSDTSPAWRPGG